MKLLLKKKHLWWVDGWYLGAALFIEAAASELTLMGTTEKKRRWRSEKKRYMETKPNKDLPVHWLFAQDDTIN